MLVSILHRATGTALAIAGGILLIWWLVALASGAGAYASFLDCMTTGEGGLAWFPTLVFVGLTWSFFQHMFSGVRHLVLDTGAGYELRINKFWSLMTIVGSLAVTVAIWFSILARY